MTVVNRDAVERVAPPPSLRVVEYVSGAWAMAVAAATEAAGLGGAAAGEGGPGGGACGAGSRGGESAQGRVAAFAAGLARARRRLQCSSDYFE